jgi:myosin heavy subunit
LLSNHIRYTTMRSKRKHKKSPEKPLPSIVDAEVSSGTTEEQVTPEVLTEGSACHAEEQVTPEVLTEISTGPTEEQEVTVASSAEKTEQEEKQEVSEGSNEITEQLKRELQELREQLAREQQEHSQELGELLREHNELQREQSEQQKKVSELQELLREQSELQKKVSEQQELLREHSELQSKIQLICNLTPFTNELNQLLVQHIITNVDLDAETKQSTIEVWLSFGWLAQEEQIVHLIYLCALNNDWSFAASLLPKVKHNLHLLLRKLLGNWDRFKDRRQLKHLCVDAMKQDTTAILKLNKWAKDQAKQYKMIVKGYCDFLKGESQIFAMQHSEL